MAYQAGQLIQERFIISHCYEDILHSLWWDKISALSIALCMTIRFLIQIVSVLVVFICRLDTICWRCVFDCAEIRRITFAFFSSRV
ncbi:Uncharacterised protein [Salmonella enterica subsp. enterica]|uniref:Uncharacterized protein n=1 Tax=Salmonella enterica I TaxID=59201 RepID=A0A3S4EZY9_SALET|nr:Uncharacterised protein [Salmonella enterica subsp. enterica]